jgi:hypothetical protein
VQVKAGMTLEPAFHFRMLVGAIVIGDQMQIQVGTVEASMRFKNLIHSW